MRFKIIKNQHDLQNHQNPAQSRKSSKPSLIIKSQHHLPKSSKSSLIIKSQHHPQSHQKPASSSKSSKPSIIFKTIKAQQNLSNQQNPAES